MSGLLDPDESRGRQLRVDQATTGPGRPGHRRASPDDQSCPDEVSAALADARAAQNEANRTRELTTAELSYKEDLDRTKFRGGNKPRDVLPIELLNSLDLLANARVNLVQALVRYDSRSIASGSRLGAAAVGR